MLSSYVEDEVETGEWLMYQLGSLWEQWEKEEKFFDKLDRSQFISVLNPGELEELIGEGEEFEELSEEETLELLHDEDTILTGPVTMDVSQMDPEASAEEGVVPNWYEKLSKVDVPFNPITVINNGTRQRVQQTFQSSTQFCDYTFGPCEIPESRRMSRRSRQDSCYGLSYKDAERMAILGWDEGLERVNKLGLKIADILMGKIPLQEIHYDVTGEQLDVSKWLEGQPEDFMEIIDTAENKEVIKPKVIEIVATIDIAQTPDAFFMRGAAVVALATILEQHGIRVKITAHIGTNDVIDTWIVVKDPAWPTNMANLAFFTCHPAMFWYMSYACWEQLPQEWRQRAGNVGTSSMGWISEPVDEMRGDVYISAINSRWLNSEEKVLQFVKGELQKAGILVED